METGWRQEEMKDLDAFGCLKAQGGDGWVCGERAAWGGGVWEAPAFRNSLRWSL